MMIICSNLQRIGKRNPRFGNKRTSRDHTHYRIIKITQNTEKSPGHSRRFVVTQNPVGNYQLMLVGKTFKRVKNNNYDNNILKPESIKENETQKILWEIEGQIKTIQTSWRMSGDHPNYSIIENGQNTEKSPGDLRRLAVTQTPVKDHQVTLIVKFNPNTEKSPGDFRRFAVIQTPVKNHQQMLVGNIMMMIIIIIT